MCSFIYFKFYLIIISIYIFSCFSPLWIRSGYLPYGSPKRLTVVSLYGEKGGFMSPVFRPHRTPKWRTTFPFRRDVVPTCTSRLPCHCLSLSLCLLPPLLPPPSLFLPLPLPLPPPFPPSLSLFSLTPPLPSPSPSPLPSGPLFPFLFLHRVCPDFLRFSSTGTSVEERKERPLH